MDLLTKVVIAAIVVGAIAVIAFYVLQSTTLQHVTIEQAEALILSDLQVTNPGAMINITNATPSVYPGSWRIVASVVSNFTSPCPAYSIYTFDYPKFAFVNGTENKYTGRDVSTGRCVIYGLSQGKPFLVSSYPVAIAKSYLLNVTSVMRYISAHGFGNVVVSARFYNQTNVLGTNSTNVWVVDYSSRATNFSVRVVMTQLNGTLLGAYNISNG